MTNAERIKALRNCGSTIGDCGLCFYKNHPMCHMKLMIDAADALEVAEKQVNEFIKNETHSSVIKAMSRRIAELEAQIPKRGEWIHGREIGKEWKCGYWITYFEDWHCSNCGVVFEQESKPKYNFCPNCGAKMKFNDKQKIESKNTKSPLEYDYCGTPKCRYDIDAKMTKGEQ